MMLDLTSLEKAVAALRKAVDASRSSDLLDKLSADQQELVRSGVIQHFEFTYELCWKFIQRWLRENVTAMDADHPRTRKELFRLAAQHYLITDPLAWFSYTDARNLTAHTYDRQKAEQVYMNAIRFVDDAQYLLKQLQEHND